METFRNLLVGIELVEGGSALTPGSRTAARLALWLAERTGARVDFLHSTWGDDETPPRAPEGPSSDVLDELAALRREHRVDSGPDGLLLSEERPYVALSRRVAAAQADLVVVARRDYVQDADHRFGGVAQKLLRKCPGPVWVVHPAHPPQHRSILAATDLTPVGDRAVDYGAYLARTDGCDLVVVHAWQLPIGLQLAARRLDADTVAEQRAAIPAAALEHLRALPALVELGDKAHLQLTCDAPSRAIRAAVEQHNPDLVVMGTLSRSGVAGLLMGNTAERLLPRLTTSLLALKPVDFVSPLDLEAAPAETRWGERHPA